MPRIRIEDKHTYSSKNLSLHGRMSETGNIFDPAIIQVNFPNFPGPGTDENDRIGRKITTSSLMWETFLALSNTITASTDTLKTLGQVYRVYANYLDDNATSANYENFYPGEFGNMTKIEPMLVSIREFVVEFDLEFFSDFVDGDSITVNDEAFKQLMYNWFSNLVIQNGENTKPSNKTIIKRESTGYTGQFNILFDKMHYLSFTKPIVHIKETIPYKRTLNFNSGEQAILPTNKVVCHFFVGPTSPLLDYGNLDFGYYINDLISGNNNNKVRVCRIFDTLKLKYVDI